MTFQDLKRRQEKVLFTLILASTSAGTAVKQNLKEAIVVFNALKEDNLINFISHHSGNKMKENVFLLLDYSVY